MGDATRAKRMRIDECINLVQKAKMVKEEEEEVVEMDEPVIAPALINLINIAQSDSRTFTSEERELRKDRGDRLLQLFREQPSLSNSASARRIEKNIERAAIWEEITKKINEEFGEKLEVLTVDKVKKLLTYYKKKEEGNFDNIEPLIKLDDVPEPIDLIQDTQPLANFLSLITGGLDDTNQVSIEPLDTGTSTLAAGEKFYMLKKERHEFVVKLAEHYINRMCFDNSSRSAAVNAERHSMWIKITQQTNDKYAGLLGGLGVEQAKKLYSNCKRRRRIKTDAENSVSPVASSSHSTARPSAERDEISSSSDTDGVSPELFHIMKGIEKTQNVRKTLDEKEMNGVSDLFQFMKEMEKDEEIQRLQRSLQEKEKQIKKLTELIEKQTSDHKNHLLQLIDELRMRVVNNV